jgi:hypothetical protein
MLILRYALREYQCPPLGWKPGTLLPASVPVRTIERVIYDEPPKRSMRDAITRQFVAAKAQQRKVPHASAC